MNYVSYCKFPLFILCWVSLLVWSCSEDETNIVLPGTEDPGISVLKEDSLFYSTSDDEFELIAGKDDVIAFMQTDTTFAFRFLFDSCGVKLLAYADSAGRIERVCVEDQVIDFLYHQDEPMYDIMCRKEGKLTTIQGIMDPYSGTKTRASASGDVPFSAIGTTSRVGYTLYSIINSGELYLNSSSYKYLRRYSAPPYQSELAVDVIKRAYGNEYKQSAADFMKELTIVARDYRAWVIKELFGDAVPTVYPTGSRSNEDGTVKFKCNVKNVDPAMSNFRVGLLLQEYGKEISSLHNMQNSIMSFDTISGSFTMTFRNIPDNKHYQVLPYLAPATSSEYLTGIKCLLEYYKYGEVSEFHYMTAKAEVVEQTGNKAVLELSTHLTAHKRIKMGVIYSNSETFSPEETKTLCFEFPYSSDIVTKRIELENKDIEPLYYKPFIIYDGNLMNKPLPVTNDFTLVLNDDDRTFYGQMDNFHEVFIHTNFYEYEDEKIKMGGGFLWLENPDAFGICYSTTNENPTIDDNVLEAESHNDGDFSVYLPDYDNSKDYYYRSFVKKGGLVHYGKTWCMNNIMESEYFNFYLSGLDGHWVFATDDPTVYKLKYRPVDGTYHDLPFYAEFDYHPSGYPNLSRTKTFDIVHDKEMWVTIDNVYAGVNEFKLYLCLKLYGKVLRQELDRGDFKANYKLLKKLEATSVGEWIGETSWSKQYKVKAYFEDNPLIVGSVLSYKQNFDLHYPGDSYDVNYSTDTRSARGASQDRSTGIKVGSTLAQTAPNIVEFDFFIDDDHYTIDWQNFEATLHAGSYIEYWEEMTEPVIVEYVVQRFTLPDYLFGFHQKPAIYMDENFMNFPKGNFDTQMYLSGYVTGGLFIYKAWQANNIKVLDPTGMIKSMKDFRMFRNNDRIEWNATLNISNNDSRDVEGQIYLISTFENGTTLQSSSYIQSTYVPIEEAVRWVVHP